MVGHARVALFITVGLGLAGCGYVESPLPESTVSPDIYLEPFTRVVEDQVSRDATFATLLASHELGNVAYAFVEAMRPVFNPRALRRGHPYKLIFGADGVFRRFEYHVDENQYLQVVSVSLDSAAPLFEAFLVDYEKELEQVAIQVTIDGEHNSLMAAMSAAGGHDLVAMSMAEVFSAEIDFNTKRLKTASSVSVIVTVMVSALFESSDTRIDLITAVVAVGTVYNVVASVLVKSAFLLTNAFAIILKISLLLQLLLLNPVEMLCLIFVQYYPHP